MNGIILLDLNKLQILNFNRITEIHRIYDYLNNLVLTSFK